MVGVKEIWWLIINNSNKGVMDNFRIIEVCKK